MSQSSSPFGNIDHVALIVENMRESVKFYEKLFGFKQERSFGNKELGIQAVVLKRKESRLELFEYSDSKPEYAKNQCLVHGMAVAKNYFEPGIKHIAFRTSKFQAAVSSLKRKGLAPAILPKTGYSGDSITFFKDPNGVLLELVSPLKKLKKMKRASKKKGGK